MEFIGRHRPIIIRLADHAEMEDLSPMNLRTAFTRRLPWWIGFFLGAACVGLAGHAESVSARG
jgi:hypothetical protein